MNVNFALSATKNITSLLFNLFFFSLMFVLHACQNNEVPEELGTELSITANISNLASRAMNTNTSFVNGDKLGVMLEDVMGEQYTDYADLQFTYDKDGTGKWQCNKNVLLMNAKANLYGYYPYTPGCDMTAIPVDMTASDQIDWMYATPVTGVYKNNAQINMNFNHMLANIQLVVEKGNYTGAGAITSVSLTSNALATKGVFNAAQGVPGFISMEGAGEEFVRAVSVTAGTSPIDIMVIPTGNTDILTIYMTVDGVEYVAQGAEVTLQNGYNYQYTIKLKEDGSSL